MLAAGAGAEEALEVLLDAELLEDDVLLLEALLVEAVLVDEDVLEEDESEPLVAPSFFVEL